MIESLSEKEKSMLLRIKNNNGTWPARPLLNRDFGISLMRKGLIEFIEPKSPCIPYAIITKAGINRLEELE